MNRQVDLQQEALKLTDRFPALRHLLNEVEKFCHPEVEMVDEQGGVEMMPCRDRWFTREGWTIHLEGWTGTTVEQKDKSPELWLYHSEDLGLLDKLVISKGDARLVFPSGNDWFFSNAFKAFGSDSTFGVLFDHEAFCRELDKAIDIKDLQEAFNVLYQQVEEAGFELRLRSLNMEDGAELLIAKNEETLAFIKVDTFGRMETIINNLDGDGFNKMIDRRADSPKEVDQMMELAKKYGFLVVDAMEEA